MSSLIILGESLGMNVSMKTFIWDQHNTYSLE